MGFDPISIGFLAVSALSAGASAHQQKQAQKKQASAQKKALQYADEQARKQADAEAQAHNRLNQKRADPYGMVGAMSAAERGGVSGTMLTGPQGVNIEDMKLGKSTLLGG